MAVLSTCQEGERDMGHRLWEFPPAAGCPVHSSCGRSAHCQHWAHGQDVSRDRAAARAGDLTMYVFRTAIPRGMTAASLCNSSIEPSHVDVEHEAGSAFEKVLVWAPGIPEYRLGWVASGRQAARTHRIGAWGLEGIELPVTTDDGPEVF